MNHNRDCQEENEMRSDYSLYVVALICFVIAGVFLSGAIPLADNMGLATTAIFFILGIIFAAAGYTFRPKVAVPTPAAPPPPLAEPSPPPPPPPVEEKVEEVPVAPPAVEKAPPPAPPPTPTPITPTPALEEPVKAEEEKPEEKPVRRRRRKKAA